MNTALWIRNLTGYDEKISTVEVEQVPYGDRTALPAARRDFVTAPQALHEDLFEKDGMRHTSALDRRSMEKCSGNPL